MIDTGKYDGEGKWILGENKGRPCINVHEDSETPTWTRYVARNVNPRYQSLLLDAPLLLKEVKKLREDNHDLRMADWEYERVWEWLMENADNTCRKLLHLIEEWKEEDGLVTIGGRTYYKEERGDE